jgi:hypothetical protein
MASSGSRLCDLGWEEVEGVHVEEEEGSLSSAFL